MALRLPSAQQPLPGLSGRKTQPILEEKLRALEEECKQKETERVNLELELTEVKESLRKALAGGITLGLAIEPRSGTSSPQVVSAGAPGPLRGHGRPEGLPVSLSRVAARDLQRQHGQCATCVRSEHLRNCVGSSPAPRVTPLPLHSLEGGGSPESASSPLRYPLVVGAFLFVSLESCPNLLPVHR